MPDTAKPFPFIEACFGRPVPHTPIWIMRQAGRYLPEYRAVRAKTTFWGLCETPELAAEVTLQPIDRLGVDAAILFSDILVPVKALGFEITFHEGEGPRAPAPLRDPAMIDTLTQPDPKDRMHFVYEAIRLILQRLEGRVPLIGFCGAPFTLASYMVEGGGSKNYLHVKQMMYGQPEAWHRLMTLLTDASIAYLRAMVEEGVHALQVFDSWVGCLSEEDYVRFVLPYTQRLLESVRFDGVPVIHFGVNTLHLLPRLRELPCEVIGLDWRMEINHCRGILGDGKAIQGNFDPCALFKSPQEIREGVGKILDANGGRPGHVFNLGHGILPPTNPDHAKALVDAVHELSAR